MQRRDFFKTSAMVAGTLAVGRNIRAAAPIQPRVSIVKDATVIQGGQAKAERVSTLLDRLIRLHFEASDPIEVFRQRFSPKDRVGIKVNCLSGRRMSTHVELVDAIVQRLLSAGVLAENILIWDRLNDDLRQGGFRLQTLGKPISCAGCDTLGYEPELTIHRSIGSFFALPVTRICTAMINVPVLKDHGIVGVTLGMKNFFGAIHNPNKYHLDHGDPFVADLYSHPDIGAKVRMTIVDALEAQCEGGPPFQTNWCEDYGGLMLSDDPVACDRIGWVKIEELRKKKGLPTLKEAERDPTYIHTAAHLGLGTDDLKTIEVRQG